MIRLSSEQIMHAQSFGKAIAVACASFAITNIDDMFVLITFFSESATSTTMTPFRIVLGQYIGFTSIITISLIGFGVSFLFPTEPIGFMGFVPLLLGVWRGLCLIPVFQEEDKGEDVSKLAGMRSIFKVAVITLMNGGDNIGTYIPLFSQAKKDDIAIYVVTYYFLVGLWCLIAFLVMRQKHVLILARRYIRLLLPFLYLGLGLYIIIKSSAYPWSIKEIDHKLPTRPGKIIMGVVTASLLIVIMGLMAGVKLFKRRGSEDGTTSQRLSDRSITTGEDILDKTASPPSIPAMSKEDSITIILQSGIAH